MVTDWEEEEPGLRAVRQELYRLGRRALRRPLVTLAVALLVTAAAVRMRTRRPPSFEARVVLSVTEGGHGITEQNAPRPPRQLREYVRNVVLSAPRVKALMEKHQLSTGLLRRSPADAIASFREDIGVDVYRNYFMADRSPDEPPRSARVALTFGARNARLANAMVRDLADLIVEAEANSRQEATASAARAALVREDAARHDLSAAQAVMARDTLALRAARDPEQIATLQVQLADDRQGLQTAEERLKSAIMNRSELDLRASLESRDLGLRFEVVEERLRPRNLPLGRKRTALLAAFLFCLAAPLAAVFVGAFDTRVYDLDDVRRLGLTGLGHVPGFRGDRVGSLKARGSTRSRQTDRRDT